MIRVAAFAALLLAACAGATTTATTSPPAPAGPHPVFVEVRAAEDFDGHPVATALVDGEPTIFIVFASWCDPCRNELAILTELRQQHPQLHVVGLNAYEDYDDRSDEGALRAFLIGAAPWLTVVKARPAWLKGLGGVPKIPSLYVFDGKGALAAAFPRHKVELPPTKAELEAVITPLLP